MYTDVETVWQTTLERNPNAWMAHNNFGAVLLRKGQPKEAMAHFRRALELKADHAGAQANFGDALFQEGQLDKAIAHNREALEIKPQDVQAQANLAWALVGSLRMEIEHYEKGCPYRMGDYSP
jgi:tetratricopeptide (TPR) repeat protein